MKRRIKKTSRKYRTTFGTVDLRHNLEAGRSEDSTGKEMKS